MLSEILRKLKFRDLLTASEVSKYWRDVAAPIIANSAILPIRTNSIQEATEILGKLTIGYKHLAFYVSFVLEIYIILNKRNFVQLFMKSQEISC